MATDPDPQKASDDALYDRVHRKTWGRRTAGFLAGATLFGAIGAMGGLAASFLPWALGAIGVAGASAVALPGLAAIGSTIALFTGAAAFLGILIGGDVGSNAGSVTAGVMEYRNSDKPPEDPSKALSRKPDKIYSPVASATFSALFAGFGALIALNPLTASAVTMMGFAAGTAAASAASGTMFGLLGASLGINFPMMSSKLSNFYSELFKGKSIPGAIRSELVQPASRISSPQPEPAKAADAPAVSEPEERAGRRFASEKMRFSLQGLIEKTEEQGTDKNLIIR